MTAVEPVAAGGVMAGGRRTDGGRPNPSIAAAVAAARGGWQRTTADRSALIVNTGFYVMVSGVLAAVWATATDAAGGSIVGYTTTAIVWYVITTEASIMSLPMRLIEEVGDDIGSERVAIEMLRPTPVLVVRVATEVGRMLPRLLLHLAVGGLLATAIVGPPPVASALALAVPALVLAVVINLVAQHAFAAAAFWVRDAKATWFLYQKLVWVLGGMLLPLEVLPSTLEAAAKVMPLMTIAYAPARLASGHFEPWLLVVQVGWLVALTALATFVFGAGQRRLVSGDG